MVQTTQQPTQQPEPEEASAPDHGPRPKTATISLSGQSYEIKRLGTRDGLAVAQQLLTYISQLKGPMMEAAKGRDLANLEGSEAAEVAMQMLAAISEVLADDDLLKFLARLLGLDIQIVGDAPLEDTMNAIAGAVSINDMPALMKAGSRIWREVQNLGVSR